MKPLLLITGASRGIGAATAALAAAQGWAVALNYARDEGAAQALAERLRAAGAEVQPFRADVSDDTQVSAMFAAVDVHFGLRADGRSRLRGLVNNAGVVDVASRVDAMNTERVRRLFAVNVLGSFSCAREAILRMSTRHGGAGGSIVNLSSVAAKLGSGGLYVDYAATKGAIDTFTVGLAVETATEGIRVNAVRPGIIDTEIHASGGHAELARQTAASMPMQRAGTADEVAQGIVWLLSDAASYVTGAVLDVAGGR